MKLISSYSDLADYKTYRASLHNHTFKDGIPTASPRVVLGIYQLCKIPIVAITDHDRRIHPDRKLEAGYIPWREKDWNHNYPDAVLIKGFEASFSQEHVNVLGFMPDEISYKPGEQGFVDSVHEKGGFTVLNHPAKWNQEPEHVIGDSELSCCRALEVYNGGQANEDLNIAMASELWDKCLSTGVKMFAMANSDCHEYDFTKLSNPQSAWNVLWLKTLNQKEVFSALKEGRFYATTGVEIDEIYVGKDRISLIAPQAQKITFFGHSGKVLLQEYGTSANYIAQGDEGYIRIEVEGVVGDKQSKAWLQPVWLSN